MCLFTSSLFVSGHLPPSFIIQFLRVSLCLFRMGHSLIKCSEFWKPVWQGHVWSSIILNLYREDLTFPCPVTTVDSFRCICIRLVSLSCFIISLLCAFTCFQHYVLIIRRSKLYCTASGIITLCRWPSVLYSIWYRHTL